MIARLRHAFGGRALAPLVVVGGAIYLALMAKLMTSVSYDIWVLLLVSPVVAIGATSWLQRLLRVETKQWSLLTKLERHLGSAASGVIVVFGLGYLVMTGLLMTKTSYDVWGAFIAAPVIGTLAMPILRKVFSGELEVVQRAAMVGLLAKLGGTIARYYVATDAYGGQADSTTYHQVGKTIAGELYHGKISIVELMPHTTGSRFISELAGLIYSMVGSSKLAGFMWFALMGYAGVVLCVKAACIAVPGLAMARYGWLCFLMPSIVFWPSGIGKEAWMSLTLGAISLGAAYLFTGRVERSFVWMAAGAVASAMVRPHMTAMWLGGVALALIWAMLAGRLNGGRQSSRVAMGAVGLATLLALVVIANITLNYLNPPGEDSTVSVTSQVTSIFTTAGERTEEGGSEFTPVVITGPLDYPEAILRTLSRPLLYEADSLTSLLPALEMTFLVLLLALSWPRVIGLPRALRRNPYVLFCMLVCIMFGLAFSTFANLAILVRQRSLVMPMMLILPCLPVWTSTRHRAAVPAALTRSGAR